MLRPCLGYQGYRCTRLISSGSRCGDCITGHNRARELHRGDRYARGYGAAHYAARASLKAMLPAPCGYCGIVIERGATFVAAHARDGHPEYGWMLSHASCNERAKVRMHTA